MYLHNVQYFLNALTSFSRLSYVSPITRTYLQYLSHHLHSFYPPSSLDCAAEQDITEDEDEFDGTLHVRHGKKLPATSRYPTVLHCTVLYRMRAPAVLAST